MFEIVQLLIVQPIHIGLEEIQQERGWEMQEI